MAGQKETPRQKMIGMMYLVLTALLALQVSSALIYKFQALNSSLEKTVASTEADNRAKQENIAAMVSKRGNNPNEVQLHEQALRVRKETQQMLVYIEGLKKELIERTGGYDERGDFKGANEETEVEVMMIGANKQSGKAYALKQQLDAYVVFMSQHSARKFDKLAPHANEEPSLQKNADQRNKDYAQLNFGQTPMVAALAVLSETASKVVNMENAVLAEIAQKVGIDDYPIDRLTPVVKPKSDFVVAGTKYEAEMFMAASSSSLRPEMEMGGQKLQVGEDGRGALNFMATGGNYRPDGTIKKTWTGKIKMKRPNGTDTVYNVEHEYVVVKPVIQVQTGNVPLLYRNCGNKLDVLVPALGASYKPSFRVEGASVIEGSRPGLITLVPTAARVNLDVSNQGTMLGRESFGVKLIPLPSIEVKVNNRKVSPVAGLLANEVRSVSVRVVPEKGFAEALPEDARYYLSEGKIMLARGRKEVKSILISGQNINITPLIPEMRAGDRLVVEVTKVKRLNFRNQTEDVSIPNYYETIVLN
jgi:gliding motility-associated protein GldM